MGDLQLTPLGTSPAWYNPGEPSSGFLLEASGFRLLVDCGGGVIARYLDQRGNDDPIDGIIVTHVHADHVSDLVPLTYGMEFGSLAGWAPQLWLPPGAHDRLRRMVGAWDAPSDFFDASYDVHDFGVDGPFELGPFTVSAALVPHFIDAYALRVEAGDQSFGYTSDMGPAPGIAGFFRGVDLLLSEATLPDIHAESPSVRGHLTATEAGQLAKDAAVHSLLLTHVPVELQPDAVSRASAAFGGPVALAASGTCYPVGQRLARAV